MSELLCHKVQPTHCILLRRCCCVLDAFRNGKKRKGKLLLRNWRTKSSFSSLSFMGPESLTAVKMSTPEDTEVTGPVLCSRPSSAASVDSNISILNQWWKKYWTPCLQKEKLYCQRKRQTNKQKKQSSHEVKRNRDLADGIMNNLLYGYLQNEHVVLIFALKKSPPPRHPNPHKSPSLAEPPFTFHWRIGEWEPTLFLF